MYVSYPVLTCNTVATQSCATLHVQGPYSHKFCCTICYPTFPNNTEPFKFRASNHMPTCISLKSISKYVLYIVINAKYKKKHMLCNGYDQCLQPLHVRVCYHSTLVRLLHSPLDRHGANVGLRFISTRQFDKWSAICIFPLKNSMYVLLYLLIKL